MSKYESVAGGPPSIVNPAFDAEEAAQTENDDTDRNSGDIKISFTFYTFTCFLEYCNRVLL